MIVATVSHLHDTNACVKSIVDVPIKFP